MVLMGGCKKQASRLNFSQDTNVHRSYMMLHEYVFPCVKEDATLGNGTSEFGQAPEMQSEERSDSTPLAEDVNLTTCGRPFRAYHPTTRAMEKNWQ